MTNFKPIDVSKEEFRKYLESTGFLDAMTKVLVKCNITRPENPIEFVIENLREVEPNTDQPPSSKTDLQNARAEIDRLKKEVSKLKGHTTSDEQQTVPPDVDPTEDPGATQQNKTAAVKASAGEGASSIAQGDETAAVTAGTAALTISEQSQESESKAVDVATTTGVQKESSAEKRDEKEKEGDSKN